MLIADVQAIQGILQYLASFWQTFIYNFKNFTLAEWIAALIGSIAMAGWIRMFQAWASKDTNDSFLHLGQNEMSLEDIAIYLQKNGEKK